MTTKIIKFYRPELIGESNLVMRLHLPGRSTIVNGTGTSATIDAAGLITASVTETLTRVLYAVAIYDSVAAEFLWTPDSDSMLWMTGDAAGTYYVGAQALSEQVLAEAKNLEAVERSTTDTRALEFDGFVAGQTFANSASTCKRLFPGESEASAEALTGAITLVRAGRYSIAYAVADRVQTGSTVIPTEVLYTLVDDLGNIGYFTLRVTSRAVIGDVAVLPLVGTVQARVEGTNISLFTAETPTVAILVVDTLGASVDLTAMVLSIVFENRYGANVATIADTNITRVGSTISFVVPSAVTTIATTLNWSLRNGTSMLLRGYADVVYAAEA